MSLQALPQRRVASPPSLIAAVKFNRLPTAPARLWPSLSAETQTQVARIVAELMRRMLPTHGAPGKEIARAERREAC